MGQRRDTIDMVDTSSSKGPAKGPGKGPGRGKIIGLIIALLVVGGAALGYFLSSKGPVKEEVVAKAPSQGTGSQPQGIQQPKPAEPSTPVPPEKYAEKPVVTPSPTPGTPATTPEKSPTEPVKPLGKAGEILPPTTPAPVAQPTAPEKPLQESPKPLAKVEPTKPVTPGVPEETKLQSSDSLTAITAQAVIHFNSNHYKVKPSEVASLKEFLGKISGSGGKLAIEGHADSLGPAEFNQKLSEARARQVVNLLKSMGISKEYQLIIKGYGINQPVGDNKTPKGRAENRRVVISYSK